MDRSVMADTSESSSIPHTRGDGPFAQNASNGTASVFPTRVGMDRKPKRVLTSKSCIPHTRGDGPCYEILRQDPGEYSPHAWGWTMVALVINGEQVVFPTRVGMDRWMVVVQEH